MTKVQQKTLALLAACLLAVGCALALALPQQANALETRLVAGSSFAKATNLVMTDKTFTAANRAEFNAQSDNNYYKFKTTNRNSRYKLTLRSYDSYPIYVTVYDSSLHRIAYMMSNRPKVKAWVFQNLKRNAVYYIEVWRFMANGPYYIGGGSDPVLDMGTAEWVYPRYRIALKEVVTKPKVNKFRATSPSKGKMKLTYANSYDTDGVQIEFWWSFQGTKTAKNTYYRTGKGKVYITKVKYPGRQYQVRIRPYKMAEKRRVYGKWTTWRTLTIAG